LDVSPRNVSFVNVLSWRQQGLFDMSQLRLLMLVLGGLMLPCLGAQAAFITIDAFAQPTPTASYAIFPFGSGGSGPNPVVLNSPTGAGSTRTATITVDSPTPPNINSVSGRIGFFIPINQGIFQFDSDSATKANAVLNYSNFTGSAGNFYSVAIPTYIDINFLIVDPGLDTSTNTTALNMPVDIMISTTGGTLSGNFLISSSTVPSQLQIPISSLGGIGDLSQVMNMSITFNGGPNQRQATDFVVTSVILEAYPAPVPPTALLAIAGMPVLGLLRRLRRA